MTPITFQLSREEAQAVLTALENEITACEDNLTEAPDDEELAYLGFIQRARDETIGRPFYESIIEKGRAA